MKKNSILFLFIILSFNGFCQKGNYILFGCTGAWDGPNCYEVILKQHTDTLGFKRNCKKIFLFPPERGDSFLYRYHWLDSVSYNYVDSIVNDVGFLATIHYKDPSSKDYDCPGTILKALSFKNGRLIKTVRVTTVEDCFKFLYRLYQACNKLPNSENLKDELDYLLGRQYEYLPEFGKNQAPYFRSGYRIPK